MTIDFNQASEQSQGAIPEDSIVIVCAEIRPPKPDKQGTMHPLFVRSSTSEYEYLDFEFTVISTKFKDRKIWQNFMLAYTGTQTEKSNQAISISMRTLRAMVEAHRKISPKDASPTATKARIINDFSDLNSMMFPIVVGCEWGKTGDSGKRYLNNTIKKIVTPDSDQFAKVFDHPEGALISNKPLPAEPSNVPAKPTWAAPAQSKESTGSLPGVAATGKPPWAK